MYTYIWCKFSLVTKGIRVIEDQRDPVGSLALRGLLVVLDHVACRGTEELQDLVAPRDQRYVINLSKTEWLAITLHEPRLCMIVKKEFCLSPKSLFTYKYALSMFYLHFLCNFQCYVSHYHDFTLHLHYSSTFWGQNKNKIINEYFYSAGML